MPPRKIATCCYCGTRATLVLAGEERHELSCASCAAPLHNLKMLPKTAVSRPVSAQNDVRRAPRGLKAVHPKQPHPRPKKVQKRKKRRGLFGKIVEELWDEIEDIFD